MLEYDQLSARILSALTGEFLPGTSWHVPERNEQRIAVAVCEATSMTPERWDRLTKDERIPWLHQTLKALERQPSPNTWIEGDDLPVYRPEFASEPLPDASRQPDEVLGEGEVHLTRNELPAAIDRVTRQRVIDELENWKRILYAPMAERPTLQEHVELTRRIVAWRDRHAMQFDVTSLDEVRRILLRRATGEPTPEEELRTAGERAARVCDRIRDWLRTVENLLEVKTAGYSPSTEMSRIVFELNNPPTNSPAKPGEPVEVPNPFDEARRPWLPILKEHIGQVPELAGALTEEKLRQWLWRRFKVPPTQDLHAEQLVALFEGEQTGQPSQAPRTPSDGKPTGKLGSAASPRTRGQAHSGTRVNARRATVPNKTFRWLHLTDLHFGLAGQKTLWPNIREAYLADLATIAETAGPWNAVLFTGDFTQRGTSEEFQTMEVQVLEPLWETFRRLGSNPILLAVPGNHDLTRPNEEEAAVRQMTIDKRFHEIAKSFWQDPGCQYRIVVAKAFDNYMSWWSQTPFSEALDVRQGIIPGDFSTTVTTPEGLRIGIVGLNTTFLQLVSGDFERRLACDMLQLHEVCGGDPSGWCADKDACILLTHQPPNWFFPVIEQRTYPEINPAGRFVLHLFGHMHENVIRTTASGGGKPLRQWQGCSLFGLESFGDNQVRRHGYSAGTLDYSRKRAAIRHWPRKAVFDTSAGWRFARDSESCSLRESDGGTEPDSFDLRAPSANTPNQLEMRIQRQIQAIEVPDADDRKGAIRVLGEIGPPAKRAIRRLMRVFQDLDEDVRVAAGEAVRKMGECAIPYLRTALNDPDPPVRGRSAGLLGEFAPEGADAIPDLIRLLLDPHTGVRRTAAASLARFGPLAKEAAPSLCRLLADSDRDMRRQAAQTLGQIKTVPDETVTALAAALPGEPDEETRRSMVYALGDIGSPLALDALARAVNDPQRHVAALAAEAIGKIGVPNDAVLSSLIDAVDEFDYDLLQFNAIKTLGIIKSCRPDVIAALRRIVGNVDSSAAFVVAWALGEIGPAAASAIPELRRLASESPEETIRRTATDALRLIDPDGNWEVDEPT